MSSQELPKQDQTPAAYVQVSVATHESNPEARSVQVVMQVENPSTADGAQESATTTDQLSSDPLAHPSSNEDLMSSSDTIGHSSPRRDHPTTSDPTPKGTQMEIPEESPARNAHIKDEKPHEPAIEPPAVEKSAAPAPTSPNPRLQALASKRRQLESKLATLQAEHAAYVSESKLPSGLDMPDSWTDEQKSKQAFATANGVVQEHITLLHSYNEMKDIGLGLLGLVAEKRGVRVAAVLEEFGMSSKD